MRCVRSRWAKVSRANAPLLPPRMRRRRDSHWAPPCHWAARARRWEAARRAPLQALTLVPGPPRATPLPEPSPLRQAWPGWALPAEAIWRRFWLQHPCVPVRVAWWLPHGPPVQRGRHTRCCEGSHPHPRQSLPRRQRPWRGRPPGGSRCGRASGLSSVLPDGAGPNRIAPLWRPRGTAYPVPPDDRGHRVRS